MESDIARPGGGCQRGGEPGPGWWFSRRLCEILGVDCVAGSELLSYRWEVDSRSERRRSGLLFGSKRAVCTCSGVVYVNGECYAARSRTGFEFLHRGLEFGAVRCWCEQWSAICSQLRKCRPGHSVLHSIEFVRGC